MWDLKIALFGTGSVIVILTTVVLGFLAPRRSAALQKLDDEVQDLEYRFSNRFDHLRDFQLQEAKGLEMRSAMMILEVNSAKDSPQYKRLAADIMALKQGSLILLATSGGVSVTATMIDQWKALSDDALEEAKRKMALQAQPALQSLRDRRKDLQTQATSAA